MLLAHLEKNLFEGMIELEALAWWSFSLFIDTFDLKWDFDGALGCCAKSGGGSFDAELTSVCFVSSSNRTYTRHLIQPRNLIRDSVFRESHTTKEMNLA